MAQIDDSGNAIPPIKTNETSAFIPYFLFLWNLCLDQCWAINRVLKLTYKARLSCVLMFTGEHNIFIGVRFQLETAEER